MTADNKEGQRVTFVPIGRRIILPVTPEVRREKRRDLPYWIIVGTNRGSAGAAGDPNQIVSRISMMQEVGGKTAF